MNIRGMVRFSLVDYPGKISCVAFVGNCNLRCPFCHNPHLVLDPESQPLVTEDEFFAFLKKRIGRLDGVVISGGEPSMRKGLQAFARKIKDMGFLVKLDTNGTSPEKVRAMHEDGVVDYLGVDYKSHSAGYGKASGTMSGDIVGKVAMTISYAIQNKISIDVRTTIHKSMHSVDDISMMRKELDILGVALWTIQQFNPVDILDPSLLSAETYSDTELAAIAKTLDRTKVRGLAPMAE